MSLSRRAFVRTFGVGRPGPLVGAWIAARGREALAAELWPHAVDAAMLAPPAEDEIRISSNENPLGPGKRALEAILEQFDEAGRYPVNSQPGQADLIRAIAELVGAKPDQVVLGAGSGEILDNAMIAFASKSRPFVTASPSFIYPREAERLGIPAKAPAVDSKGRLDLAAMAEAARGAGWVFVCNPNNPTGTVHSAEAIADFVRDVRRSSPDTVILIDEAYHDYVTDPSYKTAIPLALSNENVLVSRTFSKAYGMAGLRLGYCVGSGNAIKTMQRHWQTFSANVLGIAAAYAAVKDQAHIEAERRRNTQVREFTMKFFKDAGYEVFDSQANFILVNIRRPAREFREACAQHKVFVGRDFPPLEKTHARISLGTMEEMQRAVEVFRKVLGATPTSASRG
jgi:histidinol-phosphate aminotransferase